MWEFPEHEDFHYAQELSKEICKPNPASSSANVLTTSSEVNSKKRKSENATGKQGVEAKKSKKNMAAANVAKPIDSFFRKT